MWFEKSVSNLQKISLFLGVTVMLLEIFEKGGQQKPKTEDEKKKSK